MKDKTLNEFKLALSHVKAGSTTNFKVVFDKIVNYVKKRKPQDLTILLFSDGMDTCNTPSLLKDSLDNLTSYLKTVDVDSRFFTIGLSREHDSILLSRFARAGSELGNFMYIDTSAEGY